MLQRLVGFGPFLLMIMLMIHILQVGRVVGGYTSLCDLHTRLDGGLSIFTGSMLEVVSDLFLLVFQFKGYFGITDMTLIIVIKLTQSLSFTTKGYCGT